MHYLSDELVFPPVVDANKYGILAIGGDLSVERLELAYHSGIFPWFNEDEPIIWWAPPKRMVLFPNEFKVSKSLRGIIKKEIFTVTFNQNFKEVISNCKTAIRAGQDGTWISSDMIAAYCELHYRGLAKSVEVWQDEKLVGGLYGIDLGHLFCGESMFSKVSNASKVAFAAIVENLRVNNYQLLDCQVYNDHLASLGCREISRVDFMKILQSKERSKQTFIL